MIRGVHHVAVATGDLDRLIGFYRDLLGLEVISEGASRHAVPRTASRGR